MGRRGLVQVLTALLLGIQPSSGQEVVLDSFAGLGARAMGMGGAYAALSADFTGLFWNPAGIARAKAGEVYTSFSHEDFRNRTRFFGTPSSSRISSTRLNALGILAPYPVHRGSLVFAGGFGRTNSLDTGLRIEGYDTVSNFEKSGFSEDSGAMGAYVAGAAVDVAHGASVGVSVQVWRGDDQFRQELTQTDTRDAHGDTVSLYQRFTFTDRYKGLRLRGGFLYHNDSGVRFGLTVASPMTADVESTLEDEYEDVLVDGTLIFPPERFSDSYSIRFPFEFGAGLAWENERFTLSGDAYYADLQSVTYSDLPGTVSPQVEDFQAEYRSAFRYHLGGEARLLDGRLALRAGYYRDPVRYLGGTSGPEIKVENDRDVVTFGLGSLLERTVVLDLAVTLSGYRQVEGNREDRVRHVRVFASTGYRF